MNKYDKLTSRQKLLFKIIRSSTPLGVFDVCKLAEILDEEIKEYCHKRTILVLKRDHE